MGLKLITPPAVEPILAADIYTKLGVKSGDIDSDDLAALITTARVFAEEYTGRALISQTWEMALDAFPVAEIELLKPPITSVTSVKYLDSAAVEQTMDSADYSLDDYGLRNWLLPAYDEAWPDTLDAANAVKIRYVAGYGASGASVPAPIVQAMVLIVSQSYRAQPGLETGLYPAMVPNAAKELLNNYRLYEF
jgi:uncharacterized phiE125 gp8 family phage protein